MPSVLTHSAPGLPQVPELQQTGSVRALPAQRCFTETGRWVGIKSSLSILRVPWLLSLLMLTVLENIKAEGFSSLVTEHMSTPIRANKLRPCRQIRSVQPAPILSPAHPGMG